MNNNFNEQLERDAQRGDEWMFGAVARDIAAVPYSERVRCLPNGVYQYNLVTDTYGCASRAPLNILETKLNYLSENGMHPAIKKWLDDNGYRVDGKFALSDNFIEILSNTTRNGNSLKAPVDAIRKYGVIPARFLPLEPNMSWDEYMNKNRITEEMYNLGIEFLNRLPMAYEKVEGDTAFLEACQVDMLSVAVTGWTQPVNGVYPRTGGAFVHAVARLDNEIQAFDNYDPFLKLLAKDFSFFGWAYSLSIVDQIPYQPLGKQTVSTSVIDAFLRLLRAIGIKLGVVK